LNRTAPVPGLARIRRELRTRESEGILHARRFDHIGDERQRRRFTGAIRSFELKLSRSASLLKAVAVGLKVRGVDT